MRSGRFVRFRQCCRFRTNLTDGRLGAAARLSAIRAACRNFRRSVDFDVSQADVPPIEPARRRRENRRRAQRRGPPPRPRRCCHRRRRAALSLPAMPARLAAGAPSPCIRRHPFDQAAACLEILPGGEEARSMHGTIKTFSPISRQAGPEWLPWAYCRAEIGCGHNARLDLPALIARFGDMPSDRFRKCLRCSKCGGRARLVIGHR
jgi:hypothetical protein